MNKNQGSEEQAAKPAAAKPPKRLHAAYRRVDVNVTEEQILLAKRGDSSHCMIADALKAALPDALHVSVDLAGIRFTDPGKAQRYIFLTPPIAQTMLVRFDQGGDVQPFRFSLRAAAQVIRTGRDIKSAGGRKVQGLTLASGSSVPVKMGGSAPPVGPLYMGERPYSTGPSGSKSAETIHSGAAPSSAAESAREPESIHSTSTPDAGQPAPNPTLEIGRGHVRRFGMRQLQP